MNCTVTSAKNFSGQSGIISRISPVQSAVSVRKSALDRPFIRPILDRAIAEIARMVFDYLYLAPVVKQ